MFEQCGWVSYIKDLRSLREAVLLREMDKVHGCTTLLQMRTILKKVMSVGFIYNNEFYNQGFGLKIDEGFRSWKYPEYLGGDLTTLNRIAREKQDIMLRHLLRTYLGNRHLDLEIRNHFTTGNNFFRFATKVIVWHEQSTLLNYLSTVKDCNYYESLISDGETPYKRLRVTGEALKTQFLFFEAYESNHGNFRETTRPLDRSPQNIEHSIFDINKKGKD